MGKYPDSVLTKNRRGQLEVRKLLSEGRFVKYSYVDPRTGKDREEGKLSIILDDGKTKEHFFLIPMKGGRHLLIDAKERPKKRMVWDGKKAVEV